MCFPVHSNQKRKHIDTVRASCYARRTPTQTACVCVCVDFKCQVDVRNLETVINESNSIEIATTACWADRISFIDKFLLFFFFWKKFKNQL